MMFRLFIQDVGERNFSGCRDVEADTPKQAVRAMATDKVRGLWCGKLLIALPMDRKDLWPDAKTGAVLPEALTFR